MTIDSSPQPLLSTAQRQNYIVALTRVFSYQNRDGSWGRSLDGRVTYTSQAIQLMLALGINHSDPFIIKSTRWMEDHIQCGDPHWATRLEIGLKIGDFEKLVDDHHIDSFFADLEYDLNHPSEEARLDFFWHVIPTLLALHPYEENYVRRNGKLIPHEKVIARAMGYCESFRDDCITVKNQPNHTGLIALYLSSISDKEGYSNYKKTSSAMVNWLLESRIESSEGTNWLHGKGITSYVLMDLLGLPIDSSKLEAYIPKILKYLTPTTAGKVDGDIVTTFETKLHSESLYATMLVLRAMTEVLKRYRNSELNECLSEARYRYKKKSLFLKLSRFFYYHRTKFPVIISVLLCLGGGMLFAFGKDMVGSLVVSTGFASVIYVFFDWLNKAK